MQTSSKKSATRSPKARQAVKTDDANQSAAFIEKARELEAAGESSHADTLMGRLAKMKPERHPKKAAK
jgi:hypothetical protein